jgi:N-dimethylarginine dimethylaminohydrolase
MEVTARQFGCQSMTGRLLRVLVRAPRAEDRVLWRAFGWRAEPDPALTADEHKAFRALLAEAGAEVVVAETPHGGDPDSIYVYDPALVCDRGAILLRPGKEGRRGEVDTIAADLVEAGVPTAARLEAPALAEGGDTLWLDERTLLVGVGYRTNEAGVRALREALPEVEVIAFDLPHLNGAGEVLHLMSLLSPLDSDLAVVYLPLLPVRLVQLLAARGIELVEVPEEEFPTMGPNVLALAPRPVAGWRRRASTCARTEATRSLARATAGRPASRARSSAPDLTA